MKHIGDAVRFWREARNYTQEYMASELGISQQSYRKLETGESRLESERLFKIAAILEVDVNELRPGAINIHNALNNNSATAKPLGQAERELYERMIAEEKRHSETLEKILERLTDK